MADNIVWTKDRCPYCDMAKDLLRQQKIKFEERNLDHGWSRDDLLAEFPDAKTVPQILLDGMKNQRILRSLRSF